MARQVVELLVPEAPSANVYWRRHGKTIHVSAEARAYKQAVSMLASRYKRGAECAFPSGDLVAVVIWHRSAKRGDLPNRTKVLYDALQGSVYADDRQIAQERTARVDAHPSIPKGYMQVRITRLKVSRDAGEPSPPARHATSTAY
jgi:Holliday junction resolvase RusA-like endonuclease